MKNAARKSPTERTRKRGSWSSPSLGANLIRLRESEDFIHVLTPENQRIVEMRLDGRSVGDIAEEMGLSLEVTYVRLSAAAKRMEDVRLGRASAEVDPAVPFYLHTHKEIGQALGISRTRVQQIERIALLKIRASDFGREVFRELIGALRLARAGVTALGRAR